MGRSTQDWSTNLLVLGFDSVPDVFPGLGKTQLSWRFSDHYPPWVEFRT